MVEPKNDDRAYNHDRFYRHGVFKSGVPCLRFSPDYGYFRRHDDVLKRLPCLQLKFQSFLAIGMMAVFSAKRANHNILYVDTSKARSHSIENVTDTSASTSTCPGINDVPVSALSASITAICFILFDEYATA